MAFHLLILEPVRQCTVTLFLIVNFLDLLLTVQFIADIIQSTGPVVGVNGIVLSCHDEINLFFKQEELIDWEDQSAIWY